MVQQSLIEYIQRLLQQGYDAGTIRTTLLNAGYSSYDVDSALRLAGASVHKPVNTRLLVIVFLVLLVLSAGVLVVLKVVQPEPVVLSFSVNLFSTEVSAGQNVVVNIDIKNPSGRKTDGLIDFVVKGSAGRIASITSGFSLAAQTSVPASIPLPASAGPGAYTIEVTVSYGGKTSSQSVSFEVVEKAAEAALPSEALKEEAVEEARELQKTCPSGCNDLNFCTNDACVEGECVNSPITPCCGNNQCEAGESASTCALDCSERPISTDEIIASAKDMAVSNLPKAIDACNSMAQRALIDGCLSSVAEASGNKEPCAQVVDSDIRDGCYIPFAYKNDFSVCEQITNKYMKNSCLSLAEISKTQPQG